MCPCLVILCSSFHFVDVDRSENLNDAETKESLCSDENKMNSGGEGERSKAEVGNEAFDDDKDTVETETNVKTPKEQTGDTETKGTQKPSEHVYKARQEKHKETQAKEKQGENGRKETQVKKKKQSEDRRKETQVKKKETQQNNKQSEDGCKETPQNKKQSEDGCKETQVKKKETQQKKKQSGDGRKETQVKKKETAKEEAE